MITEAELNALLHHVAEIECEAAYHRLRAEDLTGQLQELRQSRGGASAICRECAHEVFERNWGAKTREWQASKHIDAETAHPAK